MIRVLATLLLLLSFGAGPVAAQDDCDDADDCTSASAEDESITGSEDADDFADAEAPTEADVAQTEGSEAEEEADPDTAEPVMDEESADGFASEPDADSDLSDGAVDAQEGEANAAEPATGASNPTEDAQGDAEALDDFADGDSEPSEQGTPPETPHPPQPTATPEPTAPTPRPATLPLAPQAETPPAKSVRIGLVDVERVLTESSPGRAFRQQLQAFQKQVETELRAKMELMRGLKERLANGANSLSATEQADLRKQIETETTSLNRLRDDKQREMQKLQNAGLASLERQIVPVIEQVRVANGFDMIVRKGMDSGIITSGNHIDVTQQVIDRLR